MSFGEIDLHDALITNTVVDYAQKTVVIGIQYYRTVDEKLRSPANLLFKDVTSLSQISDLDAISKNTFAGHINYWSPAQNAGTTFIYLADGCISITSGSVEVEEVRPEPE